MTVADLSRAQWGSQMEFFLACVGYAVGLGNVWRFPFLCYRNGGGAFLIPYIITWMLAGLPIFYMEFIVGQFSKLGPVGIFKNVAPIAQGLGWAMVVMTALKCLYYNMIIAWILIYLGHSFTPLLPWTTCDSDWASQDCYTSLDTERCIDSLGEGALWFNRTCWNATEVENLNLNATLHSQNHTSPTEEFFERYILNLDGSLSDLGPVQWKLAVSLLGAWVSVAACLIKGIKSSGKVIYFTATFPYIILTVLLVRGVTLEGASNGVHFFIMPDFEKLKDLSVWKDAAAQVFYSLGVAFGVLHTMSSYNKFNNNCFRDAVAIASVNSLTSIFAGFVVFSSAGFIANELKTEVRNVVRDGTGLAFIAYPEVISRIPLSNLWAILFFFVLFILGLDTSIFAGFVVFSSAGFIANELKTEVGNVVRDGTGLAFIAYPEVISRIPLSNLWAILFFFVLFILGLDSMFAMTETVSTAIQDTVPSLRQKESIVVLAVCSLLFLCGLPMCCQGGVYVFTLLNDYAAGFSLVLFGFLEVSLLAYSYGFKNLSADISLMLGKSKPGSKFRRIIVEIFGSTGFYWKATWMVTAPLFSVSILTMTFAYDKPSKYGGTILDSDRALAFGWLIAIASMGLIPIFAVYAVINVLWKKKDWMSLFQPSEHWKQMRLERSYNGETETAKSRSRSPEKLRRLAKNPKDEVLNDIFPLNPVELDKNQRNKDA